MSKDHISCDALEYEIIHTVVFIPFIFPVARLSLDSVPSGVTAGKELAAGGVTVMT